MESMNFYNRHYITVDELGRIVDGFSDAFRAPSETDICINEQGGYQFRLFPGGEENPVLREEHNIPLYKYEGGAAARRGAEEIAADIAALPAPEETQTTEERVAALEEQVTQADETAIELYEMQLTQEEINAAQDDALIEIYEMIGG